MLAAFPNSHSVKQLGLYRVSGPFLVCSCLAWSIVQGVILHLREDAHLSHLREGEVVTLSLYPNCAVNSVVGRSENLFELWIWGNGSGGLLATVLSAVACHAQLHERWLRIGGRTSWGVTGDGIVGSLKV